MTQLSDVVYPIFYITVLNYFISNLKLGTFAGIVVKVLGEIVFLPSLLSSFADHLKYQKVAEMKAEHIMNTDGVEPR